MTPCQHQPRQLADEKRVAATAAPHRAGLLLRRMRTGNDRNQCCDRSRTQPVQRQHLTTKAEQRTRAFIVAVRTEQEHTFRGTLPCNEVEQLNRSTVRPVQVVENYQQWRVAGEPLEEFGD